jgi:hypothetical protein
LEIEGGWGKDVGPSPTLPQSPPETRDEGKATGKIPPAARNGLSLCAPCAERKCVALAPRGEGRMDRRRGRRRAAKPNSPRQSRIRSRGGTSMLHQHKNLMRLHIIECSAQRKDRHHPPSRNAGKRLSCPREILSPRMFVRHPITTPEGSPLHIFSLSLSWCECDGFLELQSRADSKLWGDWFDKLLTFCGILLRFLF